MTDNKNTILAIVLSAIVLIAWQYFVGVPQQKAREEQVAQQQQKQAAQPKATAPAATPAPAPAGVPQTPGQSQTPTVVASNRAEALKASQRVAIKTDLLEGSIALK